LFLAVRGAHADTLGYTDLYTLQSPAGFATVPSLGHETAAGGQVAGYGDSTNGRHAILWTPTATSGIDLHPSTGYSLTELQATNGIQQVGDGIANDGNIHAMLWSGSAASFVDLHPASGYTTSGAYGVGGTQQAGFGKTTSNREHAMVWTGGADSFIDLHPASGFTQSIAYGTSGTQQVGSGTTTGGAQHALLWSDSASSVIDLHPSAFTATQAFAASGAQQVGAGRGPTTGLGLHALLWNGSADSYVDLHPGGRFTSSVALGTDGEHQVGYVGSGVAWVWSGSAESGINLHALLPIGYSFSIATSVSGNTVYGYGMGPTGAYHALAWTLPEPTGMSLIGIATFGLLSRRERHTQI
jgi:hypothetical protein